MILNLMADSEDEFPKLTCISHYLNTIVDRNKSSLKKSDFFLPIGAINQRQTSSKRHKHTFGQRAETFWNWLDTV